MCGKIPTTKALIADCHTWSFGLKVAWNIPTLGRSVGRGTGQTERPKIGIFQATFKLNAVAQASQDGLYGFITTVEYCLMQTLFWDGALSTDW